MGNLTLNYRPTQYAPSKILTSDSLNEHVNNLNVILKGMIDALGVYYQDTTEEISNSTISNGSESVKTEILKCFNNMFVKKNSGGSIVSQISILEDKIVLKTGDPTLSYMEIGTIDSSSNLKGIRLNFNNNIKIENSNTSLSLINNANLLELTSDELRYQSDKYFVFSKTESSKKRVNKLQYDATAKTLYFEYSNN